MGKLHRAGERYGKAGHGKAAPHRKAARKTKPAPKSTPGSTY